MCTLGLLQRSSKDSVLQSYSWQLLFIMTLHIKYSETNKMLFETKPRFIALVHTESKPTYRNKKFGYALLFSKLTLVIAPSYWVCKAASAVTCFTLNYIEIPKSSMMQISRKQNLASSI